MTTADVLVIGAGPAGASTALQLARAGFDVVLLDRASFPRAKACGDCLSPQSNLLLSELGLLEAAAAGAARLTGWRVFAADCSSFEVRFEQCTDDSRLQYSLSVVRHWFDHLLLQHARAAGVLVREAAYASRLVWRDGRVDSVIVRSAHGEGPLRARVIVGADGLHSTIRRQLGLAGRRPRLRKAALTAHLPLSPDSRIGELHLGHGACFGFAPASSQPLINLTLTVDAARFAGSLRGRTGAALCEQLERFPALRDRIPAARVGAATLLGSGPFDWPTRGLVTANAALVGDAGGYYDPFTGQGIYQALLGGQRLAAAIQQVFQHRQLDRLRDYERVMRAHLRGARAVQRMIEQVCARPALGNRVIRALNCGPRAARDLICTTSDLAPPHRLLSPAALFSFCTAFLSGSVR